MPVVELRSSGLAAAEVIAVAREGARVTVSDRRAAAMARSAAVVSASRRRGARLRRLDRLRVARQRAHPGRPPRGAAARADPLARRRDGAAGRARGRAGDDAAAGALARDGLLRARGPSVVETISALLNAGMPPVVPAHGSVGASGDLAPLAHCALPLIGEGDRRRRRRARRCPPSRAWRGRPRAARLRRRRAWR